MLIVLLLASALILIWQVDRIGVLRNFVRGEITLYAGPLFTNDDVQKHTMSKNVH